jgi:hypothetical protein
MTNQAIPSFPGSIIYCTCIPEVPVGSNAYDCGGVEMGILQQYQNRTNTHTELIKQYLTSIGESKDAFLAITSNQQIVGTTRTTT